MRRDVKLVVSASIVTWGLLAWCRSAVADVGAEVRALTGAHTRVVWVQDAGDKSDPLAERDTLHLMGFDSDDGKGEHPILPAIGSYAKPLITPTGEQVVFGSVVDKKIYVVNWDGSGLKAVVENASFEDVWRDPANGTQWIYARVKEMRADKEIPVIRRFRMDSPSVSEIVWDKAPVGAFRVSGDGKAACGSIDGNGLLTLPNGQYRKFYGGCWPSIAPDDSHLVWVFRGHHKGVHIYTTDPKDPRKQYSQKAEFDNAPGVPTRYEMYHPRWSNHVRFMTITGGYWYKEWKWKDEVKLSNEAAEGVEIYLGRFTEALDGIEGWVQISHNKRGDFMGDAWIDPKSDGARKLVAKVNMVRPTTGPVLGATWPGNTDGIAFIWDDAIKTNQIIDAQTKAVRMCMVEARDLARFGRYQVMDVTSGSIVADGSSADLLAACRKSGQLGIDVILTPAEPTQMGEANIISFSSGAASQNFTMFQRGSDLWLRLRTSQTDENGTEVKLGPIEVDKPAHVIVSYTSGKLLATINGRACLSWGGVKGNFSNWTPQHLLFGDEWDRGHNWAGTIEAIALYSRTLGEAETSQRVKMAQARLKDRAPAERVIVEAKLLDLSTAPAPEAIAPYRRCLSTSMYEVQSVVEGKYEQKKVLVAHWCIMDAKVLVSFQKKQKGQTYRLTLEKFADHPELESERMVTGVEELDLPMYYDVGR